MLDDDTRRRYEDWIRQCFMSLRDAATDEPIVDEIHFTNQDRPGTRARSCPTRS